MEAKYFASIKPRTNDVQRVHKEGCPFLEEDEEKIYLGRFISGRDAEAAGLKLLLNAECCRFCSKQKTAIQVRPLTPIDHVMFCCVN